MLYNYHLAGHNTSLFSIPQSVMRKVGISHDLICMTDSEFIICRLIHSETPGVGR